MISLKQSLIGLTAVASLAISASALAGNGFSSPRPSNLLGDSLATTTCTGKDGCIYNVVNHVKDLELPSPMHPEQVMIQAYVYTDGFSGVCWYAYGTNGGGSTTPPTGKTGVTNGSGLHFNSPDDGNCQGENKDFEIHTVTQYDVDDFFFQPLVVSTLGDTVGGTVYVTVDTPPTTEIVDNKLVVTSKGTLKISGLGSVH